MRHENKTKQKANADYLGSLQQRYLIPLEKKIAA